MQFSHFLPSLPFPYLSPLPFNCLPPLLHIAYPCIPASFLGNMKMFCLGSASKLPLAGTPTTSKWQCVSLPRDELVVDFALSATDDSCLLFCESGCVYVVGDPIWETGSEGSKSQTSKFRPVKSLLSHAIESGSCSEHIAAVISKGGTLYCAGLNLAETMRWRPISKSKLIYKDSVVIGQEYLSLASRYNASYWCEVKSCLIERNHVSVDFTVKTADLSLGPLQEPVSSTLYLDKQAFKPTGVEIRDSSDKHISGVLKFDTTGTEIDGKCTGHFVYGAGGYSKALLFDRGPFLGIIFEKFQFRFQTPLYPSLSFLSLLRHSLKSLKSPALKLLFFFPASCSALAGCACNSR